MHRTQHTQIMGQILVQIRERRSKTLIVRHTKQVKQNVMTLFTTTIQLLKQKIRVHRTTLQRTVTE